MVHIKTLIAEENKRRRRAEPELPPISYRTLARAVGTSPSHVCRHANEQLRPRYESAQRYARFFGVRVAEVDDRFSDAP